MLIAALVIAVSGLEPATEDSRLAELSAARSEFGLDHVWPDDEKLLATLYIGTNNLGNPWREWYFPSGSASYKIYLINWYGDTGALAKESVRDGKTYVDWVIDLRYEPKKEWPKPKGTLSIILWNLGYEIAEEVTEDQAALLAKVQGYAGYVNMRGPFIGYFAWYVYGDGRLRPYCNEYGWRSSRFVGSEIGAYYPITLEEGDEMGIESYNGWSPSGWFDPEYRRLRWTERPFAGVPGRSRA